MKKNILIIILMVVFISCDKTLDSTKPDILKSNLDINVKAGDDFFEYANGGWLKNNPIPNEQASWGLANVVIEENQKRLFNIIENAITQHDKKGSNNQKIADFWLMAMDSIKIETDGLTPIKPLLDKIDAITDVKTLMHVVAELKKIGSSPMFTEYIDQDLKQSNKMALYLYQGGIGLPNREYYIKTDSTTVNIRQEYVKYISTLLSLGGEKQNEAEQNADNILAFETQLANASWKLEELRDPHKNYNKMTVIDLNNLTNKIDWYAYLKTGGIKKLDTLIVGQPDFFRNLNDQLQNTPIQVLKQYVKFHLLQDMAPILPNAFGEETFKFKKLFSGAKERKPRWKRMIRMEENAMGELLGQMYVKKYFNEHTKIRYINLVDDIKLAMKERISKLTWMSDSTKQKAYIKLAAIKSKVGYPDKWKDFSSMKISKRSFAENFMNSKLWWYNHSCSKLGKPIDKDEWNMYPQTYNAYYNPSNNEIVLPAGIFTVPGYKDNELDDALVYGYVGASTIGHEITHGFDDEGRQFDEKGNLVSWWTIADEKEFNKRAKVMVNQFDNYEPIKGYSVNGKATLGENIADLGGVLLGLEAFKKTKQFKENKKIGGLTPLQRYFLGYAYGWLSQMRDDLLKNRIMTDVHSPAKYRVNGPFVNVDDFYLTFDIKPGDKMFKADSLRVKIW